MNIGVFCASSDNLADQYLEEARKLGKEIINNAWDLVYGGTDCGLMREVADTVIAGGRKVTGILPECIYDKGIAAQNINELIIAPNMQERKKLLREYSDVFIALPGGWGTLEEITEVITLKQLGIHNKAIVFLNTDSFYDSFFSFIDRITDKGFVSKAYEKLYFIAKNVEDATNYIRKYKPIEIKKKY